MDYLLRIEGVNIFATVDDTRQISVRRGSSLLLKQAIKDIDLNNSSLELISSGASIGLFQFQEANSEIAEGIRQRIATKLSEDSKYQFFTFVVDTIAYEGTEDGDFKRALEKVIALNRFHQFQQPTLVFPPQNSEPELQPCAWDNLRPANGIWAKSIKRENTNVVIPKVSQSVETRHDYGRDKKHEFVKQETGISRYFTHDLHEIAEKSDQPQLSSLADKLAIIYFDGNGFGSILDDCDTPKSYMNFDVEVQTKRREWLKKLVQDISHDSGFLNDVIHQGVKKTAIRLELLLWGGDEIMLAVPAWRGMYVLQHFYRFHQDWEFNGKNLSYAGGLVFCHVKTPMHRIQRLSKEIADHVKEQYLGQEEGKIDKYSQDANLYEYTVLESIDYPTQSWPEFLENRYSRKITKGWQAQQPFDLHNAHKHMKKLVEDLPGRQLYQLAEAIIDKESDFEAAKQRFDTVVSEFEAITANTKNLFPGMANHTHWLHLAELWDYLNPACLVLEISKENQQGGNP